MRPRWCISAVVDRWRRWRARRPGGRAGRWRLGVSALAVLVLTAGLAVLLAVVYGLAWPPVLVAIVGTLPALYLAWLAVPGVVSRSEPAAAKPPVFGCAVGRWDPVQLGVHQVIGRGPMPAYVRRPHDELLEAVLDPAVPGSRLVVVRGGSSTGKTRAAYQAVAARLGDWQLDYPLDSGALAARLEMPIPAGTVLWLGELRQYADADGGAAVLARVADVLAGEGLLVITTIWPEQWTTYTGATRSGADPAGTAGRLLERLPELTGSDPAEVDPARGGVIDVPDHFTAADLQAVASSGDQVLAEAAAAAGQGGQVTQYLAGVPELLARYSRPGGDPYGQAVITASMDAIRLGHASPLPPELIQEAAVGYLTGPQRTKPIATWRDTALAWATEELNGAVRALQPLPPAAGTGVEGYQVADYLDQHARRTRQDQLGPPSLWDAVTEHVASASDLTRLGGAARGRGLYRYAAALWTKAAALGSMEAAARLIPLLRQISPDAAALAARWAAAHVALGDPQDVTWLCGALRDAWDSDAAHTLAAKGAAHASLGNPRDIAFLLRDLSAAGESEAVSALLAREPAAHAGLGDPGAVAGLLWALREAGDSDAAHDLATRAAAHANLGDQEHVAFLLRELTAGARDAAHVLATRAAAHTSLDDPGAVTQLLRALRQAVEDDAVSALLARDPAAQVSPGDPRDIASLLGELREAGDGDAASALAIRAAAHTSLDDPGAVAQLLGALRWAGNSDATKALLARDPAANASLGYPLAVTWLLEALREAGDSDAAHALATRAAAHTSLGNPRAVADLLHALHTAGDSDAVAVLLARDPVAHVSIGDPTPLTRLGDPTAIAWLLEALREAGDGDAARALAARAAAHTSLYNPGIVASLLKTLRKAGDSAAVTALLARDPAANTSLGNPTAIAWLLEALREAGHSNAARALATRAAIHANLVNTSDVARLLEALREAGDSNAARALATRAGTHASLDHPQAVAVLLHELREAGRSNAARALARRAANAGMFDLFSQACPDEAAIYPFGREPDGIPSRDWKWREPPAETRGR